MMYKYQNGGSYDKRFPNTMRAFRNAGVPERGIKKIFEALDEKNEHYTVSRVPGKENEAIMEELREDAIKKNNRYFAYNGKFYTTKRNNSVEEYNAYQHRKDNLRELYGKNDAYGDDNAIKGGAGSVGRSYNPQKDVAYVDWETDLYPYKDKINGSNLGYIIPEITVTKVTPNSPYDRNKPNLNKLKSMGASLGGNNAYNKGRTNLGAGASFIHVPTTFGKHFTSFDDVPDNSYVEDKKGYRYFADGTYLNPKTGETGKYSTDNYNVFNNTPTPNGIGYIKWLFK